ncbi:MAG: HDOD domain-containing protein [Bryobacteraceae bacterium]|nr:HDOD domain-containing protein [Bryobacteraceae bacterium]
MRLRPEAGSAHAVRVGAIAAELGAAMGFDDAAQRRLQTAGRHHDCAMELYTQAAFARLSADVLGRPLTEPPRLVDPRTFAVLRAFVDPRWTTEENAREVEILRIADAIDNEREFEPYAEDEEEDSSEAAAGVAKLRCASRAELRRIAPRLPVFPAAAKRAVLALTRPEVDRDGIEEIASSDPVLAGALVSAANSALYSPRQEIRCLPRAVSHIGCDAAKMVLLAAVLRPVFAIAALRPQWRHAVEAADAARQLAAETGAVQPDEALLAALVHDIGVLAVSLANPAARLRCDRLIGAGCPRRAAEWLSCGFDHAEASAVILDGWKFPRAIIEGVRRHHAPERSDSELAALLYLVEFWTCSDEDIPSTARLTAAARRIGTTEGDIIEMKAERRLTALAPIWK